MSPGSAQIPISRINICSTVIPLPTLNMATYDTNVIASSDTEVKTKFGTITILTLNNYPEFEVTAVLALMGAGYWKIINGTKKKPDDATEAQKWEEDTGKAMGMLNSAVIPQIRKTFRSYMDPPDPTGLWNHLKAYDQTSNAVYVNELRNEFDNYAMDDKVDVMAAYLELQRLQTLLSSTNKKVEDSDVRARLLNALPDTDYWYVIRVKFIEEDKTLNQTVSSLLAYQRPKANATANSHLDPTAATAHASISANNSNRSNQNYRRGRSFRGRSCAGNHRGRGRGNARGSSHSQPRSRDDNKVQKDYSKDRIDPDQCAFCRKKGHYQSDCRVYKKFQAMALAEQEARGDGKPVGNMAVIGRVMTSEQIKDAGFPYTASNTDAFPVITNVDFALHTNTKVQSILDSGASRHFSGIKSDFKQLKHWAEP